MEDGSAVLTSKDYRLYMVSMFEEFFLLFDCFSVQIPTDCITPPTTKPHH